MAGYFNERLATGTHDPLHAKAIVLQQGEEQIALVSCDLVGLSLRVTTNARAQASAADGHPGVEHRGLRHAQPYRAALRGAAAGLFPQLAEQKYPHDPQEEVYYPAFLIERVVKVIAAAQANLRPAQVQAGIATQPGLAFNRRYWMKNGKVVFNPGQLNPDIVRPAGPTDPDVGILLARRRGARSSRSPG